VRTPPVVRLDEREWTLRLDALPDTPHVARGFRLDDGGHLPADSEGDVGGFVLAVGRPPETDCPEPSVVLKNWLKEGYDDARTEPESLLKKSIKVRGGGRVAFADADERLAAFEKWCAERAAWAAAALQAADALAVFNDLFDLHSRFERESEKYQLFLADGILEVDHPDGAVRHPLLLQRVELRFDATVPEFRIVDSTDPPEIYTPLLRHLGIDGRAIQHVVESAAGAQCHPLAGASTDAFLRDLAQRCWTDGQFFDDPAEAAAATGPRITRAPHLILGNRSYGLADSIDRLLAAIDSSEQLPASLLRIVGIDTGREQPDAPVDLLLTKPANEEQIEVIRRLEETGAVLVQGPPGTGKSHTIANLVGHLLAQDKSILVTSHASKALRVVREKLPTALQPLCVSVLHSDDESTRQLEESITGIVNTLASTSEKKLGKEIEKLQEQRAELDRQQQALQAQLLAAVQDEYRELDVQGERLAPAEAAQQLDEWRQDHDWLPGPLTGEAPPLDAAELAQLYAQVAELPAATEAMARAELPDLAAFPHPKDFAALLDELAVLEKARADTRSEWWTHDDQDQARLQALLARLGEATALLRDGTPWLRDCLRAAAAGGERREQWRALAQQIENCAQEVADLEPLVREHAPAIDAGDAAQALAAACRRVAERLEAGGAPDDPADPANADWQRLQACATVGGRLPDAAPHFWALLSLLEIERRRSELLAAIAEQTDGLGAPELGARPETEALPFAARIREALAFPGEVWAGCTQALEQLGFAWPRLLQRTGSRTKDTPDPTTILALVDQHLPPLFAQRERQLRLLALRQGRDRCLQALADLPKKSALQPLATRLRNAVKKGDYDAYAEAFQELARLHDVRTTLPALDEPMARLEAAAPGWAAALRERQGRHATGKVPGDAAKAWLFRVLADQLEGRGRTDLDRLQEQLEAAADARFERTASYVEKCAWLAQLRRTGLQQQQALTGWLQLQKKIGKGTGKHVPRLKEEAKQALARCRSAVPVWIMPLSRVFESFDLASTRFDVVILDEASQCDVMGLLAFALAREVVVVGDHEQVSPYAVGVSSDQVRALIDELLPDVPNRQLYDGKTSVYDLAQQSFGGTIRLLEHFRCVPDIIRFSNELCYGGEIRPLREASSARVAPGLVAHRVDGGVEHDGINEQEAQEIAALVAAMCRLEQYESCSIGVISMIGTEQALYIDSILRSRLSATEYRRRQILCGNASQFQGDERDVILLSLVNSPAGRPLPVRQHDDARKVFNVAASRARDQLWVVHSLDPGRDLKAHDLRLRLINHAEHAPPRAAAGAPAAPPSPARWNSDVERGLCEGLQSLGYRVLRRFPVGDGVIDVVVEGKENRRLAVQCDGDRALAPDDVEEQLVRQLALRRLGWRFVHLRAADFLRDRDRSLAELGKRLRARGVEPAGGRGRAKAAAPKAEPGPSLPEQVIQRAAMIRSRWQVPSPAELLASVKAEEKPDDKRDDPNEPKAST
jgi:hypothetical protein